MDDSVPFSTKADKILEIVFEPAGSHVITAYLIFPGLSLHFVGYLQVVQQMKDMELYSRR